MEYIEQILNLYLEIVLQAMDIKDMQYLPG